MEDKHGAEPEMTINTVGDYYLRADELKLNQCYLCGAKKRSKWELDVHIRGVHAEGEGKIVLSDCKLGTVMDHKLGHQGFFF